jgi:hypothetical protein
MDRTIPVRTGPGLRGRTNGNAPEVDDKVQIIWLARHPHASPARAISTSPTQSSGQDVSRSVLRWMFDALVDGFALYGASFHACELYPPSRSLGHSPDTQADISTPSTVVRLRRAIP